MATVAQVGAKLYDKAVREVMKRDNLDYGAAVRKLNETDPEFYELYRRGQRSKIATQEYTERR
jgi:hypothetical protein